jgi:stage III sporulation protein AG
LKVLADIGDLFKKAGKGSGKQISNLIVYIAIGVLLIITANLFMGNNNNATQLPNTKGTEIQNNEYFVMNYTESLEKQLKSMLAKIEGVGEVDVMLTLEAENEVVPALNNNETHKTTEERDNGGGERTIVEQTIRREVVILNENGRDKPLIIQEIKPRINGVTVVAEGAGDISICRDITKAVETALNVPVYKVNVLPMKK